MTQRHTTRSASPLTRGPYEVADDIAQVDVTASDVADVTVPRTFTANKSA